MVEISILICTYNRSDYLPGAIESCLKQSLDDTRFEIIVVDNNSSDGTRTIVERYAREYKNIRYIIECRQGLNFARTHGAREAKGKYIAYLDDDARANHDWLEKLLKTFKECKPAPICVGGKVFLDWEGQRPQWYPGEYDSLMAYLDHGDKGFYLKPGAHNHFLIGTNMTFNRDILLNMGGFRTEYGRKKRRTISGAETEMINRLLRGDYPVYYEPTAIVTHIVVPERRTKRFLIKRVMGDGATQPLLDLDKVEFCETNLIRRILYDMKMFLFYFFLSLLRLIQGRKKEAFLQFLGAVQKWGRFVMELRFLFDPEFAPSWKNRWERRR